MSERIIRYLFIIVSLFSSLPVYSNEVQNQVLRGMEPNSITIIGEYHKQPESIQLFQSLIVKYLQQDKCLVIALEIVSSQQAILDEIVEGKAAVSNIEISPIIDHSPFRALINDLARMKRRGSCLKLIAIDTGSETSTNRDEWMAKRLVDQVSEIPILALLGNLHALKKIDWSMPLSKASPYAAEILVSHGHRIRAYPQIWLDKTCNTKNQLIPSDAKEATGLINSSLISLLNASEYESVSDVVDGVVLWECG